MGLALYGLWERRRLEVNHYPLPHPRWPQNLKGWSIVHLTDLHVVRFGGYERAVLRQVERLNPQVIVLTGDLVDHRHGIEAFLRLARSLQAPAGVWAVFGNREVRNHFPLNEFAHRLEQETPVQVLRNAAAPLPGTGGQVWVVGVEIPHFGTLFLEEQRLREAGLIGPKEGAFLQLWGKEMEARLGQALKAVPPNAFRIGLIHTPDMAPPLLQRRVEVLLAGHTHGGQVRLPGGVPLTRHVRLAPSAWFQGLHRIGESWLFVSRGIGTSNLPFRFACRPEVAVLWPRWEPS